MSDTGGGKPLKSRFADAAKKAVAQAKQGVVSTVKTEARAAVEDVGEQIGIPPEILAAQQEEQRQLAEMEAYKQRNAQEEQQKLAQLRAALAQIEGGMQQATQQRIQTEQQTAEIVQQNMEGPQPTTEAEAQQMQAKANMQKQQIEQQMRGKTEGGRNRKG